MMTPPAALDLARRFEGLHKLGADGLIRPYICPAGVLTIGYGHTGPDVKPGMTWTREQAEAALLSDMERHAGGTLRACPVLAAEPPDRLAAVVDFAFNLGVGRLQGSTLRRRVNQRDWEASAAELRRWVKAGGRTLPGLVVRREAEVVYLMLHPRPLAQAARAA